MSNKRTKPDDQKNQPKFEKENATESEYNAFLRMSSAPQSSDTLFVVDDDDEFKPLFQNSNAPITSQKYEIAEALLALAPTDELIEQETIVHEDFNVEMIPFNDNTMDQFK